MPNALVPHSWVPVLISLVTPLAGLGAPDMLAAAALLPRPAVLLNAPPGSLVTPPRVVHGTPCWRTAEPGALRRVTCTASLHGALRGVASTGGAFMRRSSPAVCSASESEPPLAAAAAAGLVANAVVLVSLFFVATTGGGLPAGPFGVLGAVEGVSYLVVLGFVGAALRSKLSTGAGLPAGPAGLLGAAEGLSFLSVVGGLAVLALLAPQQGCVPNALPLVDYSSLVRVCK